MFNAWQPFYQMTGEAAATLTGLLFIVVSLSAGRQSPHMDRGVRLFTTPTAFHLVSVIVISALALAPDGDGGPPSMLMTAWAVLAGIYMAVLSVEIRWIRDPAHWSDFWWYGVAPLVAYGCLAAANVVACVRDRHAPYDVALCLIVVLVVAIRNAWDLITWLAPRQKRLQSEAANGAGPDRSSPQ